MRIAVVNWCDTNRFEGELLLGRGSRVQVTKRIDKTPSGVNPCMSFRCHHVVNDVSMSTDFFLYA